MNKWVPIFLCAIGLLGLTASVFGQGTFNVDNTSNSNSSPSATSNGKFFIDTGTGPELMDPNPYPTLNATVYAGSSRADALANGFCYTYKGDQALMALDFGLYFDFYLYATYAVSNVPPGANATIVLQVWLSDYDTYEAAESAGDAVAEATFTNPTGNAAAPLTLTGMPAIILVPHQPPRIYYQPTNQISIAGGTATFWVSAFPYSPVLSYRWYKGGIPLTDNGGVWGSATSALTLSNLAFGDAVGYSVVVSNVYGSVTSSVANLTLTSMMIVTQPSSRTNNAGTTAAFTVMANSSAPLSYQWYKGGVPLGDGGNVVGSSSSTLNVSNVLGADGGSYFVILTNVYGAATSSVATLKVNEPLIVVQPVRQVGVLGGSVTNSITAVGTAPLFYQWRKNGGPIVNATNSSLVLANLQATDAGNFDVTVSTQFGSTTSIVATLSVAYSDAFNPGASNSVYTAIAQPDGKILVGGSFTNLAGQPRNCIGRLNADGTLDTAFNPGAGGPVYAMALQADGKILVAGNFTTLGSHTYSYLARLNSDGTVDDSFNPAPDNSVNAIALQPDGKMLVGGSFHYLGLTWQQVGCVGRLNIDGTVDNSFASGIATQPVNCIALQPDGKILVGGASSLGGQPRPDSVGRLNADGTLDTAFNPGATDAYGGVVSSILVQPDGKIVVGGAFGTLCGQTRSDLGRLNANGTLDVAFSAGAFGTVFSMVLQADGRILLGGTFTSVNGQGLTNIARVNGDGTLDTNYRPAVDAVVRSLALQPDGKVLVGGDFTTLGGTARARIGRLQNDTPANEAATFNGDTATWTRGGSAPELISVMLGVWQGGAWTNVATLTHVTGGWQAAGLGLSSSIAVRMQGWSSAGGFNGSAAIDQAYTGGLIQPVSRTNNAGTTATFIVFSGSPAPAYQWFKNGIPLTNAGTTSGSTNAALTISNALKADEASYFVVVTNTSGVFTSSVATLTVLDPAILVQPIGVYSSIGSNATFSVAAGGTSLAYQWRKNGNPLTGATGSSLSLNSLQGTDAGNYDVVVSGVFGTVTSSVAVLNLEYCDSFSPSPSGSVYAAVPQPDGKILVGGDFTRLGGLSRNFIGRLNADGSVDTTFNPGANGDVSSFALESDGKILVGGYFSSLGGQPRANIGRLNPDGSLDPTFNPGANDYVSAIAVQADGRILVGGWFRTLAGQSFQAIGRLNADGSLDAGFNPNLYGSPIYSLALQPDGKILIGGDFTIPGIYPTVYRYLCRLNADGSLDSSFRNGAPGTPVFAMALQGDGKILVATAPHTNKKPYITRFNSDGTTDLAFNPGVNFTNSSDHANVLVLQADGKILIGGQFTTLNDRSRANIGRLNPDGSVDSAFNPGANFSVSTIALQGDGRILAGGDFTVVGGQSRSYIARLRNNTPATQSLSLEGSTLTWLRSGSVPEVSRASFDVWPDGVSWTSLGSGLRIPGGWQLSGVNIPSGTPLRARGAVSGGDYNGSTWDDAAYYGRPWLLLAPASRTNNAGGTASFTVAAVSSDALQYQWFKDGSPLSNSANTTGASASTLVVSNLQAADAATYSVIVTNSFGAVTSSVASLTVFIPSLTSQPVSCTNNAGTTATFSVATTNISGPFTLTWLKNGLPLNDGGNVSGSTTSTLTLSNALVSDAGGYSAVVRYDSGSLTSAVASLTVTLLPPQNFTPQSVGNGLTLQFTGAPNYPYVLQSTTNLVPPVVWQSVLTNTSAADGSWSWSVTNLLDTPKCFYRVVAW
jgi:uncharacterized delta-60 repeat protein